MITVDTYDRDLAIKKIAAILLKHKHWSLMVEGNRKALAKELVDTLMKGDTDEKGHS